MSQKREYRSHLGLQTEAEVAVESALTLEDCCEMVSRLTPSETITWLTDLNNIKADYPHDDVYVVMLDLALRNALLA